MISLDAISCALGPSIARGWNTGAGVEKWASIGVLVEGDRERKEGLFDGRFGVESRDEAAEELRERVACSMAMDALPSAIDAFGEETAWEAFIKTFQVVTK